MTSDPPRLPTGPGDPSVVSGAPSLAESESLLPSELPWLYVVIPLPAAYLLGNSVLDKPLPLILVVLAKSYLPFLVFGATFHFIYRFLMPRLLRTMHSVLLRAALHVGVMLLTVCVVSAMLLPLLDWIAQREIARLNFLVVSIIFSSATLFPALALQRLRHRAHRAEHRALVERKVALEAQLQALQARTDPHFLFNSINTVASLIPENPELAERTLERLADLFRYALESSRVRTVTLERELAMVSDYLELQSARFGDRLETHLSVATGLADIEVPPLLLQPLVENAIMHGTSHRRGGRVDVAVRREDDSLIVEVTDDGPGPGHSKHSGSGTGVHGVAERLRLYYDDRASLSLSTQASGGCLARLALPIASAT